MENTIYLMRHGECDDNVLLRQGIQELSSHERGSRLTQKGKEQAIFTKNKLKHVHFDAIFSSDLYRAEETALIIAEERDLPVEASKQIRERTFGIYTNKSIDVRKKSKKMMQNLSEKEKMDFKFDKSVESWTECADRMESFLQEKMKLLPGKTILVVSHGNVIRAFMVRIGYAKFDEVPTGTVENTGFLKMSSDGKKFEVLETTGIHLRQENVNAEA